MWDFHYALIEVSEEKRLILGVISLQQNWSENILYLQKSFLQKQMLGLYGKWTLS